MRLHDTVIFTATKLLITLCLVFLLVLPCFVAVPYADEWLRASHFVNGNALSYVTSHSATWIFRPINDLVQALAIQPLAETLISREPKPSGVLLAYFQVPYLIAYGLLFVLAAAVFHQITHAKASTNCLLAALFLSLWLLCTTHAALAFYWLDGLTTALIPLTALILGLLLAGRKVDGTRWLGLVLILYAFLANEMFVLFGGAFIAALLLMRLVAPSQHRVLQIALGVGSLLFVLQTFTAGPIHRRAIYASKFPKDWTVLGALTRGFQERFDPGALALSLCAGVLIYIACCFFSPHFRAQAQRLSESRSWQLVLLAGGLVVSTTLPLILIFVSKPDPRPSYYGAVTALPAMLGSFVLCVGLTASAVRALASELGQHPLSRALGLVAFMVPFAFAPNAHATADAVGRFGTLRRQAKQYMQSATPRLPVRLCRPNHPYTSQRSGLTPKGVAGMYKIHHRRVKERICEA
jgi:hypothetical protein